VLKRKVFIICLFLFLQQGFAENIQQFGAIGNLKLQSGKILYDCKIGYRTFGSLNKEKSNAILFPTWFASFIEDVISLVGSD